MEPTAYTIVSGVVIARGTDQYNIELLTRIGNEGQRRFRISIFILRHRSVVDPGRSYLEVRNLTITPTDGPVIIQGVPNPQHPGVPQQNQQPQENQQSRPRSPRRE